MKFTHIAAGPTDFCGHTLYALDENGEIWAYSPAYCATNGRTCPDTWGLVRQPEEWETRPRA